VCFWDTNTWKPAGSSRPLAKGSVAKVLFSGHGAAAFGNEPCLLLVSEVRSTWQPRPRSSCGCVSCGIHVPQCAQPGTPHSLSGYSSHWVACAPLQERPAVWGLHPETGAVDQLMAMEHLIPPGQKKVAKVYTAACHPLLPHLVAVAANSGQPTTGTVCTSWSTVKAGGRLAKA
jgi:hypothetical protein